MITTGSEPMALSGPTPPRAPAAYLAGMPRTPPLRRGPKHRKIPSAPTAFRSGAGGAAHHGDHAAAFSAGAFA